MGAETPTKSVKVASYVCVSIKMVKVCDLLETLQLHWDYGGTSALGKIKDKGATTTQRSFDSLGVSVASVTRAVAGEALVRLSSALSLGGEFRFRRRESETGASRREKYRRDTTSATTIEKRPYLELRQANHCHTLENDATAVYFASVDFIYINHYGDSSYA